MVRLEWSFNGQSKVGGLLFIELGKLNTDLGEMQTGNFFVQFLRQAMNAQRILAGFVPESQLSHHLIREAVRHHEGRMSRRTTEIDQSPFGQKDHAATGRFERETINGTHVGRLHVDFRGLASLDLSLEPRHIDFEVEVTDVTDDRVVRHLFDVFAANDITATGRRDENVPLGSGFFHGRDFETFHRGLEGTDRIDFRHDHSRAIALHGDCTALAHVTITGNDADFSGQHHVRGSFDAVCQ